jgi:hypothetical protein
MISHQILEFVRSHAGQMIGGGVADAVAARLDGVHLDAREVREDVGYGFELRPVVLDVLARREMSVATVIAPRNGAQHAQLGGGQQTVGNGDPEHGCVGLDVEAVAQAQVLELVVGEFARQEPAGLVAEFRHPFSDELLVHGVIAIHGRYCNGCRGF